MMIRRATLADHDALWHFLVALAAESRYTGGRAANPAHLSDELARLLPLETSGFFVAETPAGTVAGVIVWLLYADLITGERCASEACWYVGPPYRAGLGFALLTAAETWAAAAGATRMQMLAPAARFDGAYERRGYTRTDCVFERRLNPCLS